MNITIQVNDASGPALATVGTASQGGSTAAGDNGIDGGAPKLGGIGGGGNISAADITDIGGPPSWLLAAMDKESKSSTSTSHLSVDAGDARDGGAGPSG